VTRHAHQCIDVEPALAQGGQALAKHGEARQGDLRPIAIPPSAVHDPELRWNDRLQQLCRNRQQQGTFPSHGAVTAPFGRMGLAGGRPVIGG